MIIEYYEFKSKNFNSHDWVEKIYTSINFGGTPTYFYYTCKKCNII